METHILALDIPNAEGPVVSRSGEILAASWSTGGVYSVRTDGVTECIAQSHGSPGGLAEWRDGEVLIAQGPAGPLTAHPESLSGIRRLGVGGLDWITNESSQPIDLCIGPDGYVYWTDAAFGRSDQGAIWRADVESGDAERLTSFDWMPNGIAFGLETDAIYVAATMKRRIVRFPFDGGRLGSPDTVVQMRSGFPDGFAFDTEGNFVCAMLKFSPAGMRRHGICPHQGDDGPGELQVWDAFGGLLDTVVPSTDRKLSNVALTPDCAAIVTTIDQGAVLSISPWPAAGLALYPFR